MPNDHRTRLVVQCAAASALMLVLSGCEQIRNFVVDKEPPDEFAVVTKAPLIIPPDYNLKPPKPGLAPLNQASPTQSAEAALYSDDPKAVASTISGSYSEAEKMLLAQSHAASADDSIRQQIAADNAKMQSANDSFTDQLLFGGGTDNSDAPLNADAEKARLDALKAQAATSQPATPPAQPQTQQSQPAPAQKPAGG